MALRVASYARPLAGEVSCGDATAWWPRGSGLRICIIDGLGHGPAANRASMAALDYLEAHLELPLSELFSGCDTAIQHTRGVVMGVADVEPCGHVTYGAIGNTRAQTSGPGACSLPADSGIIGGGFERLTPDTAQLTRASILALYTDGLPGRIELPHPAPEDLEGLARSTVEACGSDRDDAGLVLLAWDGEP